MCDDGVYVIAQKILANLPAGRTVFLEYTNEPWHIFFGFNNYYLAEMAGLILGGGMGWSDYYQYRAVQQFNIVYGAFNAAGRGNEVKLILNTQMGDNAQHYLTAAQTNGWPLGAIAHAPYINMPVSADNETVFNGLSDAQAVDMLTYGAIYGNDREIAQLRATKAAIDAYNAANGKNCWLVGYECGISEAVPYENPSTVPVAYRDQRNHDIVTHPNFYFFEQDLYLAYQNVGMHRIQVYDLGMFWNPDSWGMYHAFSQNR
jgi:hypothetical protein